MQPYHLMMPANTQYNQWHLYKNRIHFPCTLPGRQLTLEQVKPLIQGREANIKSAFTEVDPDGVGLVNKEKFRQVLGIQLCISQGQVDTLLEKVRWQYLKNNGNKTLQSKAKPLDCFQLGSCSIHSASDISFSGRC